jgi:hypothetical protein
MMRDCDYVYLWSDGHVELLDQVYKVKYKNERPVFIGYYPNSERRIEASNLIQMRKALKEGVGSIVPLAKYGCAREGMYEAIIESDSEVVTEPLYATMNLTRLLG